MKNKGKTFKTNSTFFFHPRHLRHNRDYSCFFSNTTIIELYESILIIIIHRITEKTTSYSIK